MLPWPPILIGSIPFPPTRSQANLIGEVEGLKARLWARLQIPAPVAAAVAMKGAESDRLLTVVEAGERLGVDRRWLYRRADALPFTRRLSRGTLRFSEKGLEKWKEARR